MSETELLRNMVMNFRISELNMLLSFAGRSRSGRKTELQIRALDLIKLRSGAINAKIRELYRLVQQQNAAAQSAEAMNCGTGMQQVGSIPSLPMQGAGGNLGVGNGYSISDVEHATLQGRNPYAASVFGMTNYNSKPASSGGPNSGVPVHPDVKFKKLPFYDLIGELVRPSTLTGHGGSNRTSEASFAFHLTPHQATEIAMTRDARPGSKVDFTTQIQMRFSLYETSCEQEDCFPPNVNVKVNGKLVPLPNPIPTNKPGVEPKRPPRPVNVTSFCRLSPIVTNYVNVTWTSDLQGRGYVMGIFIVNRLTSSDLLQRLKNKGLRPAEYTRGLIKEKLFQDSDLEIATTTLKVSLMCPLGKMRMVLPCRSTLCSHLQCFDALLFLQMNERKPTWVCPVCDKPVTYDTLAIDGYFTEILNSALLTPDSLDVQLNMDGSWSSIVARKEVTEESKKPSKGELKVVAEVEVDLDEPPQKKEKQDYVDLTLSDSEDDEPAKMTSRPSTQDSSSAGLNLSTSGGSATSSGQSHYDGGYQASSAGSSTSHPGTNEAAWNGVGHRRNETSGSVITQARRSPPSPDVISID